jgi:hypothetical protein
VNWLVNGALAGPGRYPGMPGSINDVVLFNNANTGSATLDVPVNPITSLRMTGWGSTLTLNNSLTVAGASASFLSTDGSSIRLAGNSNLGLMDLGAPSLWSFGNISVATPGANNAVNVSGGLLPIQATGRISIGANLVVTQDGAGNSGVINVGQSNRNISLTGLNNFIDVGNGGSLALTQQILAANQVGLRGGIVLDAAHTGTLAVQVEQGGTMYRSAGASPPGVANQVDVSGAVYNLGGTLEIFGGTSLYIDAFDANTDSYWQKTSGNAKLKVDANASLLADGAFQIDIGTVQLTAPSGSSAVELDGGGLNFGNANPTFLKIVDSTAGSPEQVTVQGGVTLAQNTVTTMNFSGANNTADLLNVEDGQLTLAGTLMLLGDKNPKQSFDFFAMVGNNPLILGNFTGITDNVGGNDTGQFFFDPPSVDYYQVKIQ